MISMCRRQQMLLCVTMFCYSPSLDIRSCSLTSHVRDINMKMWKGTYKRLSCLFLPWLYIMSFLIENSFGFESWFMFFICDKLGYDFSKMYFLVIGYIMILTKYISFVVFSKLTLSISLIREWFIAELECNM